MSKRKRRSTPKPHKPNHGFAISGQDSHVDSIDETAMIDALNRKKGLTTDANMGGKDGNKSSGPDTRFKGGKDEGPGGITPPAETDTSQATEEEAPKTVDGQEIYSMTKQELDKYLRDGIELHSRDVVAGIKQQYEEATSAQQKQVDHLNFTVGQKDKDLKDMTDEKNRLSKVLTLADNVQTAATVMNRNVSHAGVIPVGGSSTPSSSHVWTTHLQATGTPTDTAQGTARIFENLLDGAKTYTATDQYGDVFTIKDTAEVRQFLAEEETQKFIHRDMELWGKGNGLIQGPNSTDAATSRSNIPDAFLEFLSVQLRESHTPQYIWWQFTNPVTELGRESGTTIKVPRFLNFDSSDSEADYLLDDGNFTSNISEQSQPMRSVTSSVEIKGYGLGRGNQEHTRPVAIPEFITATSMMQLQVALRTKLVHNYHNFENSRIQEKFEDTGRVYYNRNNQELVTDPTTIVANEDATMSANTLLLLENLLTENNVLRYDNGRYALVMSSRAATQLNMSLEGVKTAISKSSIEELYAILRPSDIVAAGQIANGYIGDFGGFMLFTGTTFGVGAVGAPGVQTTTFGTGGATTRTSYAFGRGALGRAITMPMQLRAESLSFQMGLRFIWRSIEGFSPIDLYNPSQDPTVQAANTAAQLKLLDNGQETRVFKLLTSDKPIA